MGFKEYLSRFSLSDRRKRAIQIIDVQIEAGNFLRKRIEYLLGKNQSQLPRDKWVPNTEVTGWKNNGRNLVVQLFGESSRQIEDWDRMWTEDPPASAYAKYPEGIYLDRIGQINGYLSGLKTDPSLSGNAIDRMKDWIAQHPVFGPIIAVFGLLALIFSVVRGVIWIAEKYFSA